LKIKNLFSDWMHRCLRISRRSVVRHSEQWWDKATQRGPKRCLFSGSAYPVYGLHLFSNCFDKKIRCARIYGFLL